MTAPRRLYPAAAPRAPAIEVVEPDPRRPLRPPVSIRLNFRPGAGAAIEPASFRAYYGWFGLDITADLLRHATVSADGLVVERADIPSGRHKVTLVIADTLGRVGRRTLHVKVLR